MDWLLFFEKMIWFGFAAIGFAILFNVPVKSLKLIFLIGAIGGLVKTAFLILGINVILASLGGATMVGVISIYAARFLHFPPMVFAIPSVIPMVPGVFAYRMMIGLMKLSTALPDEAYSRTLMETTNNGLRALFILLSLALGVAVPILFSRKETVRIKKNKA